MLKHSHVPGTQHENYLNFFISVPVKIMGVWKDIFNLLTDKFKISSAPNL